MRKAPSLFLLLVVLAIACQTSLPPTRTATAVDADPFGTVQTHIEQLITDGQVPSMAVAVARDGKIIWEMNETIRRYGNLVTAPGERWQYSNLGYGLLGYVISRVSGKDYADFTREEVFVPLGMDHTSVHVGSGLEEGQAVKYTSEGTVVPPCDSDSPGAAAIYGSAHDLIRFALFHLKDDLSDQRAIIGDAAVDQMQRPSSETGPTRAWEREGSGYGIGWFVGVTGDGRCESDATLQGMV